MLLLSSTSDTGSVALLSGLSEVTLFVLHLLNLFLTCRPDI